MENLDHVTNSKVPVRATIAKNLLLARIAAGLTQDALAKLAGVSRVTVGQFESGEADPRLSTLVDMAAALKINPIMLFLGIDELTAIIAVAKDGADRIDWDQIPENDVLVMKKLLSSGMSKGMVRAAAIGRSAASSIAVSSIPEGSSGLTEPQESPKKWIPVNTGAVVGAAIGSTLLPGIGTVLGSILGLILSDKVDWESQGSKEKTGQ